jgi:hypothetical protein
MRRHLDVEAIRDARAEAASTASELVFEPFITSPLLTSAAG